MYSCEKYLQSVIQCFQQEVWIKTKSLLTERRGQSEKKGFGNSVLRHTDLGLSNQGAFSITQRREGQAELRLSITLTKIEREREDILKGFPQIA